MHLNVLNYDTEILVQFYFLMLVILNVLKIKVSFKKMYY